MKKIISALLISAVIFALVGCGGGTKAKDVNVTALANQLAQQVIFEAGLKKLTIKQLSNYVTVPEGAEAAAYMSDGTTAEEIIVIRCGDEAGAKAFKSELESFLSEQRAEMERYLPEEVARIEQAVLLQRGVCVVLCVTDDVAAAEQIIKEHLG